MPKTTKPPPTYSINGGSCYAIAKGRKLGIFFSWHEEAYQHTVGLSPDAVICKAFRSEAEARKFLENDHGLVPIDNPGGWLSTKGEPILYKKHTDETNDDASPKKRPASAVIGSASAAAASLEVIDISSSSSSSSSPNSSQNSTKNNDGDDDSDILEVFPPVASTTTKHPKRAKREGQPNEGAAAAEEEEASKPMVLDKIQQDAIDAAMEGKNIFLTGVAGTGKSHVTRQIVQQAREQRRLEVGICAPTGVAAVNLNLGAQTVHSLAGIRVPQRYRDFATMFGKINVRKWNKLDMLVIDEVGMLTADFIDWLDCTVRQVRKVPHEVFGGIQMILVGDFAQLGPVPGAISMANQRAYPPHEEGADCFLDVKECTAYAFQSVMWREASFVHVHLKKVYRQSDDFFIHALRDLRESRSNSELVARLVQTCSAPLEEREDLEIPEGIRPTVLYCTNAKVDQKNFDELRSLQTEYKRFDASDTVEVDSEVPLHFRDSAVEKLNRDKFFDQCQATKALDLKVGAQVMLLQNFLDDGLVNGSRGVIDSFKLVPVAKAIASDKTALLSPDDRDKYPGYEWKDLKYGMIVEFDGQKWKIFKFVKYPLVRFMNNKTKIITPTIFERTLYRVGTVKRLQCPLRLAWALTIHKSQGSSLDLVVCDLRGCFTTGQAYVALSRAKTMPGLQIVNFDPSCVKTDPLVEEFYKAMDGSRQDMQNFLIHRAGLWWYPILDCPAWLSMFQNASKNKYAKQASRIFREWMVNYPPIDGYSGWRGYTDGTTGLQVIDPRGSAPSLQSSAMAPSEFYQTHLGISSSQRSGASSGTPQVARPYKPTKVLQPLPTQSNTQASATPPPAATSKSNISPHPPVSTRPPTSANSFGHPKNTAIVEAFQELSGHYDRERNGNAANTYRKVSNAIKGVQFEITADNAKKLGIGKNKIEGIGKASAERIYEFVTSGKIAKLEEKRAWAQAERG